MEFDRPIAVPEFKVRCHSEGRGHCEVQGKSVGLRVGQRIRHEGRQDVWDALRVDCREREDGSLEIEVQVFHPNWGTFEEILILDKPTAK